MRVEACYCPATMDEAAALLAEHQNDIRVCAGGTDLFVMMRKGKHLSRHLLDISGLGLDYIREHDDGTVSIGAGVTLTEVAGSAVLNRPPYRALQTAARHVGSLQIRNMATLAGNICTGITSADTAVPLLTLDTQVTLVSTRGTRTLPLTEFFIRPRQNAVEPDELVTELRLNVKGSETDCLAYFRKVGTRKELLISIFNAAALLLKNGDGSLCSAALAMGVAAPIPIRLPETEAFLSGKTLDRNVIERAVEIMQTEIRPRSSHHGSEEYRRLLAENILRSFLTSACERWYGGQ